MDIWKNNTVNSDLDRNFKSEVFEKDRWEYREISILKTLCQISSTGIPKLSQKTMSLFSKNEQSGSSEKLPIDNLAEKWSS